MDYLDFFSQRLSELRTQKGVSARDMSLSLGQCESYINKIGKILTKAYNDIYKNKTPLDGGFIGGTDIEI